MAVKVLLVDDEQDYVHILADRLESRGFHVRKAFNGDEALARLREEEADVVVLDVLMPIKDGLQTLGEIKQLYPLTEAIMLTGHQTIESAIDGLRMGAYDYLFKPTDVGDLSAKIKRAYERKAEQEERIRRAEGEKAEYALIAIASEKASSEVSISGRSLVELPVPLSRGFVSLNGLSTARW